MSSPYIGEIRIFGGNFAPNGWAFCDGSMLAISDNTTLFTLLGTTYGGDGINTFALPDLRGRIPLHQGSNPQTGTSYGVGQNGGVESVTVGFAQLPIHTHTLQAARTAANLASPVGAVPAPTEEPLYTDGAPATYLASNAVLPVGNNLPHDNRMPFVGVNFILSLFGIYPSQT